MVVLRGSRLWWDRLLDSVEDRWGDVLVREVDRERELGEVVEE